MYDLYAGAIRRNRPSAAAQAAPKKTQADMYVCVYIYIYTHTHLTKEVRFT